MSYWRMRLRGHTFLVLGAFAAPFFACTNDYGMFYTVAGVDASSEGTGATGGTDGATGGTDGATGGTDGATGGTDGATGGTDGATGGTAGIGGDGGWPCSANQKLCGTDCVPTDDPQTGCATVSCGPCGFDNATATCSPGGACALASCVGDYRDCDGDPSNGCEADTTVNPANCGACGNECHTAIDGAAFSCKAGLCVCDQDEDCMLSTNASAVCRVTSGVCACERQQCNPGEQCAKDGRDLECRCNGGAACSGGQTCCSSPIGCVDLQTDAANCGACGRACGGTTCTNGTCG
ncbi:MAG: hypothetical protein MUF54_14335 [Polyangiaceae bacterium]|jgi:hypothetical protein|nr:hypothetical protein [Polyangiaceae bacterium]